VEIVLRAAEQSSPASGPVEIVERKGLGHPDTLCDAVAENVSRHLSRYYLDHFGAVLHHNVDKVLLVGGESRAVLGGGEVVSPMQIYVAGRATSRLGGATIPTHEIAASAAREQIASSLRAIDVDRHVRVIPLLGPGSADLTSIFARGTASDPLANDTSCGVGFAPLTDTERAVLAVERALTARDAPAPFGADVKVMAARRHRELALTVACAMVSRHVPTVDDYLAAKAKAREVALAAARAETSLDVEVDVNVGDAAERGELYLTVTGTSAEAGDDGEVGRGNRTSGLITPYRPMTLEAAAGKNPVTHVGKLYAVLASRAASAIAAIAGVRSAECLLLSRIGHPVRDPFLCDLRLGLDAGASLPDERTVADRVNDALAHLDAVRDDLLRGHLTLY
jgi:S-adenosylmethionine synthetase